MINMNQVFEVLEYILPVMFLIGTISSDENFSLLSGSKVQFTNAATITVLPTYDNAADQVRLDLIVYYSGSQIGGHTIFCTKTDLTAFTSSGDDDVLKFFNLCEQYSNDYLENLAENAACTFNVA